jgi:hypothetical protein
MLAILVFHARASSRDAILNKTWLSALGSFYMEK